MNNDEEIENLLEIEKLLENTKNESILKLTPEQIKEKKEEVLEELYLPKVVIKNNLKKLKNYRYIEECNELQFGSYLRWINLKNIDNLKLTNGGILCEIKIDDDPILVLKNNRNQFFQINMNAALIFQKISYQEQILLSIIQFLQK